MSCPSDEIIGEVVDGAADSVAMAHVERCASCRSRASRLRELDLALQALPLAGEAPPSSLAAMLRGLVAGDDVRSRALGRGLESATKAAAARAPHRRRHGWVRTATGLGAVAAVAALLVIAPVTGSPSLALADDAISNHLLALGTGDGSGCQVESEDRWALSAWLSDALGHEIEVPELAGATLVGARRCSLLGEETAAVVYRSGESAFSVYLPPKGSVAAAACERSTGCVERAGQTVCVIADPAGSPWLMVGEMPRLDLCSVAASG